MPGQKRYPGSRPFTPDYTHLFFGRDEDIKKLSRFINAESLSVLYGKSGLGKSSLLNAGVIPKLEKEGYHHIPVRFGSFTEESILMPLDVLAQAIVKEAPEANYLKTIESEDISLWQHLKGIQYEHKDKRSILIVLDQFEELFTYHEEDYRAFAATLSKLLNGQMPRRFKRNLRRKVAENENLISEEDWAWMDKKIDLHIVMAIRSDKMSLLNKLTDSIPNILLNCYELLPLNTGQARDAIEQPALKEGTFVSSTFAYDQETLDKMVNYLTQAGTRPIESFQLQILCQYVEERLIIKKGLNTVCPDDLGELESVYQDYYDLHIRDLPSREDRRAARLLIEDGLIFQEDKRRISLYEGQIVSQYGISVDLLNELVDTHIIRSELHSSGGRYYEISHDSLVKPILRSRDKRVEAEERLARQKAEEARKEAEAARTARRRRRIAIAAFLALSCIIGLVFYSAFITSNRNQIAEAKTEVEEAQKAAEAAKDSIARVLQHNEELLRDNGILLEDAEEKTKRILEEKERAERNYNLLKYAQQLSIRNKNSYAMVVNAVREEEKDPQLALGLALASLDFSNTNTNALVIAEQIFGRNTLYRQTLKDENSIDAVALSPDGKRLITLNDQNGIGVWDINGAPLFKLKTNGHPFSAASVTPDSKYLVTGDEEGDIVQWDLETGEEIMEFSPGDDLGNSSLGKAKIKHIALSPGSDGRFLALENEFARVYTLAKVDSGTNKVSGSNTAIQVFNKEGADFTTARYSDSGSKLAIADKTGSIKVIDKNALGATNYQRKYLAHRSEIFSLAFSHDEQLLLSGSRREKAVKLNLTTGTKLTLNTGKDSVVAVAFTADDSRMLTWTSKNEGLVWTRAGKKMDSFDEERGNKDIKSANFSPDGDFVVLGGRNEARVRAVYQSFLIEVGDHKDRVQAVDFSPDGKRIVTAGWDGKVKLWDVNEGDLITQYAHGMKEPVQENDINAAVFSPKGKYFASGSDEGSVYIRDGLTGAHITEDLPERKAKIHSLAFTEDENSIITGLSNGMIKFIDIESGNDNLLFKLKTNVYALKVSPGGQFLAAGTFDGTLLIARLIPGEKKAIKIQEFQAHQAPISSLDFSPDGLTLITTGQGDELIKIWEWKHKRLIQSIADHSNHVNVTDFAPNGMFITGSSDKTAILWKWDVVNEVALPQRVLTRPESPIFGASFSKDGKLFALGYGEGMARVYHTKSLRDVFTRIAPQLSPAQRNRFSLAVDMSDIRNTKNAKSILEYADFLASQASFQADSTARSLLKTSADLYQYLLTEKIKQASLLKITNMQKVYEQYFIKLVKLKRKRELVKWLTSQKPLLNAENKETYTLGLPIHHIAATGYLMANKSSKADAIFEALPSKPKTIRLNFLKAMHHLSLDLRNEGVKNTPGMQAFMVDAQESLLAENSNGDFANQLGNFLLQDKSNKNQNRRSYQQAIGLFEQKSIPGQSSNNSGLAKAYLSYTDVLFNDFKYYEVITFAKEKIAQQNGISDILVPDLIMAYLANKHYQEAIDLIDKYASVDVPEEAKAVCQDRGWYSYSMKGAIRDNLNYWTVNLEGHLSPDARFHIKNALKHLDN
ncbi:MAG: hypothetical protein AB8F95_01230 [Bacteroidia bacterium]